MINSSYLFALDQSPFSFLELRTVPLFSHPPAIAPREFISWCINGEMYERQVQMK